MSDIFTAIVYVAFVTGYVAVLVLTERAAAHWVARGMRSTCRDTTLVVVHVPAHVTPVRYTGRPASASPAYVLPAR